jgi:type II secretory ATPase GspE/PulE/Tfp pilus assembly ATPase PilB-like protein
MHRGFLPRERRPNASRTAFELPEPSAMSDLSQPPLSLVSLDGGDAAVPSPFVWPTPPLPGYPAASAPAPGVPLGACALDGLNGRAVHGQLQQFDPARGVAVMSVPGTRVPLTLRFEQFRRLRLTDLLRPLPVPGVDVAREVLPMRLTLADGHVFEGRTLGQVDEPFGLFLFEPQDDKGTVLRSFVPRAVLREARIGPRIGEVLVAQKAATPEQVESALQQQQQMRERKLGELLVGRQIITADDLTTAIEQQAKMPMVRIGEALTTLGLITEAQLKETLELQREDRSVPLGELMVRNGLISRADLQTALARKMGYPLVDVTQFVAETPALNKLPYAVASRIPALPLMVNAGRLVVAVEDPSNRQAIDELEFAAQGKVVPVLARAGLLAHVIDRAYEKIGAAVAAPRGNDGGAIDFEPGDATKLLATLEQQRPDNAAETDDDAPIEQSDNSLVRLINSMIQEAQAQGVSDIHVECPSGREKVRIRFRRDGQMRSYLELPHNYRQALLARIKIMCDLDISEKRKPQDGKINLGRFVNGSRLELRVATIPTTGGAEDAVLRLLASAKPLPLDQLGLSPFNLQRFKDAVQRPNGMVLCVGPTGSGKTTTLHSAMGYINTPERKIWTAEDPIEITQSGLRQVQVNPRIEWTFAKALRAFLRADPDVIMVGEIRDQETAQVAVEASLTGHLVMSTLHTNSAPETVTRLLDMGMDPFNFADALLLVLAQRLVRRLCGHCRRPHEAGDDELLELARDHLHAFVDAEARPEAEDVLRDWRARFGTEGRVTLYKPVGCPRCDGTGYRGRAGIHEMMGVSRPLRHLIQTGARADQLQKEAQADGMRTLRQDGIEKVLAGVTTIDEVRANS